MSTRLPLFIFILLFSTLCYAEEHRYEFSFGTSQMLVDDIQRSELKSQHKIVLPTTSALMLGEYVWNKRWGTLVAFNMPLVTQKFIVNGELVEETASNSLVLAQRYSLFRFAINKTSELSFQTALAASTIFADEITLTPTLAMRLHVSEQTGFSMYLGGLASYGIKGYVLFYGVGHRF